MQNANNDQAHVSGLGKGRVGSRQGKKSKTLRVKYKYNLTDQMCVMFMYFLCVQFLIQKKVLNTRLGQMLKTMKAKNPKNPPRALCYNIAYHTEHH